MNIIKLINDFKKNDSCLWVEENHIKLFVADKFEDYDNYADEIKKGKKEITDCLISNKIFSKSDFQQKIIFKSNQNITGLSFAQERLWFIEKYEGGTHAYHLPWVFELDGNTDTQGIIFALQQIVARHEVLRSTIELYDTTEQGVQIVHNEPLVIEQVTIPEKDDHLLAIKADIDRPFDLSSEYPIRANFYHIQAEDAAGGRLPNRTFLLINFHHIAGDGWSWDIFERELVAYYEAYTNKDTDFTLPELEIQYKDYAVWQRAYLAGAILEKQLTYWKEKLSGYQTLELPADHPRPLEIDYSGANREFAIKPETGKKLRTLARNNGVTLHTVLLSSIHILLGKYTGQDDIVTGSPIANRHHRQTEGLIGFFVNVLVNRTLLDKNQSFADLIQQVHQEQVQAQLHQDLPFEMLVNELGVDRDPSRHPVFQVVFEVQNFGSQNKTDNQQISYLKPYEAGDIYEVEKFDLSISVDDSGDELKGQISYATALFKSSTIERLTQGYLYLLDQLVAAPGQPYSRFSLLTPDAYHQIVYEWNLTDKSYPEDKTIHALFEEQVDSTPDNTAIVYQGASLSYRELNEKSNQLAREIREKYLQNTGQPLAPDSLIALCPDRGLEMIIGMLAILKAGGAYVPIDPEYPQERIDYLLEDTQAELVLTPNRPRQGAALL